MSPEQQELLREQHWREHQAWEREQRSEREKWQQARKAAELERERDRALAQAMAAAQKAQRAAEKALAAAPQTADSAEPPRKRTPGKKPQGDWKMVAAVELHRLARNNEEPPTPADMCTWCQNNRECGYQPNLREMQKLYIRFGV